jgi:UDP-2-acetamido-3-amino-2,3-dideoxy-glucuronate N-acetyltransferase
MPINENVKLGENVKISLPDLVNIYGCEIGDNSSVGPFVEIQKDVHIGKNVKVQSHSFICSGVVIEDGCFIGHGVMFTNDKYPRAVNSDGSLQKEGDWKLDKTYVKKGASIGSGAIIGSGITIGEYAMVGMGAVVTKDVAPKTLVVGNPAKYLKNI